MDQQANNNPAQHPTLLAAADELLAIFKKYDIAGVAIVHLPGFIHYAMDLHPTYSCVEVTANKLSIVPPDLRSAVADSNSPQEFSENLKKEEKKAAAETVNMLANFRFKLGQLILPIQQSEVAVRKHYHIEPPKVQTGNGVVKHLGLGGGKKP